MNGAKLWFCKLSAHVSAHVHFVRVRVATAAQLVPFTEQKTDPPDHTIFRPKTHCFAQLGFDKVNSELLEG